MGARSAKEDRVSSIKLETYGGENNGPSAETNVRTWPNTLNTQSSYQLYLEYSEDDVKIREDLIRVRSGGVNAPSIPTHCESLV